MNDVKMQREMILQRLKEQGCRITKQRLALIDIILENECSSCKEIYYKAVRMDEKMCIRDRSGGLVSDTDRAALSYREFYLLCVYGTGQVRDRLFYADSSYLQAGCRAGAWNPMGKCASDQAIHRRRFWKQAGHSI